MTTINSVGNGLSGVTGSGNFVGANTPTLITPVLGAATATSINFGGSSLAAYIAPTSFTPTITFATPGDVSVVYTTQHGVYVRLGSYVCVFINIACTPTYTTASSSLTIASLPLASNSFETWYGGAFGLSGSIIWPTLTTHLVAAVNANATTAVLRAYGSNTSAVTMSTSQFVSGTAFTIQGTLFYPLP